MAHVGDQLQSLFMSRVRVRDPERCLVWSAGNGCHPSTGPELDVHSMREG